MAYFSPQQEEYLRQGKNVFGNDYNTTNLNANNLNTVTEIPYKTPQYPDIYPVAGLNTPQLAMTQEETKANDLSTRLQSLNEQLMGQSAYRAEQEQVRGLPELQKTQTDLAARLKAIQNEAMSIPLQLQQEATGRGVTSGGLAPIQTGRLRTNAIQALGVSSLLEASQGNLTTAQTLVDRAVAQKYDPIKEEITAAQANLELILKSPAYSLQEKNRAQAQLDVQEAKKQAIAQQEENDKVIMNLATEAAQSGADALTLKRIQEANSPEEALQIATEAGVYTSEEEKKLALSGYRKLTPSQLSQYTESQIVRMPNGDIYLKPGEMTQAEMQTQAITTAKGGSGGRGGILTPSVVEGQLSGQTQAIVDNPSLFDDLTPTVRGKVISELQMNGYDTTNLGTKSLSDTAIATIAQSQKALSDLAILRTKIQENEQFIGPISGLQKLNPWSKARQIQSDIDRVKQTVGKALEGGVLRKEDEDKYKKILATLLDTPETALYKVDSIISSLQRDIETYKSLQQSGGRSADVTSSLKKKGQKEIKVEDLRTKYNY